jgi:hypothetical protein
MAVAKIQGRDNLPKESSRFLENKKQLFILSLSTFWALREFICPQSLCLQKSF